MMRYEWFIAKRYLRPQGGATFIFHLTLISMIGVALGVASLVVVLSVMNGFANDLRSKILEGISHVIIQYPRGLEDYDEFIPHYKELDNVDAVSPAIIDWGAIFVTDLVDRRREAVTFVGIDPERDVSNVKDKIVVGSIDSLAEAPEPPSGELVPLDVLEDQAELDNPGAVIGVELAAKLFGAYTVNGTVDKEQLKFVIGQSLTLITLPKQVDTITSGVAERLILRVDGVFETGNYEFDSTWIYMSLPAAQQILSLGDRVTHIQFRLHDHSLEATEKTYWNVIDLKNDLSSGGYVQTWQEMRRAYFEALEMEKFTMTIILRIIILVATFNIIATLFMVVTEKTRDIGLLRAIGAGRRNVMFLFLSLGILIGLIGVFLGLGLGYAVCLFIQVYPIELPGGGSIYYLRYIPCEPEATDFFWVTVYTFIISLLASVYPAFRASRAVIVDSLRFS